MASFKQIKFYFLLLAGIAISVTSIVLFFTSSLSNTLFQLGSASYEPDIISNIYSKIPHPGSTLNTTKTVTFTNEDGTTKTLSVAVANTDSARQNGLMGVNSLPQNEGMLFVFTDEPQLRTFWMKNLKYPLDMIFISQDKQIQYIQKNAPACTSDPCQIYSSQYNSEYVIEVNGGWSDNNNITNNTKIDF